MNWNPNEEYKNRDVAITYDAVRFSSIPGKIFNSWDQHVIPKCFRRIPEGSRIVARRLQAEHPFEHSPETLIQRIKTMIDDNGFTIKFCNTGKECNLL